jgi:acetoin utilization protein AcuB
MLIRDVMQTTLVTVAPDTVLPEAARLVSQRGIRHLLVVEGGQLVGIVSDRDLKRAMASSATTLEAHELAYLLNRLPVREIMTRSVITIGALFPVEDAARLMVQEKIGALPVTEEGRPVGIVTETDVLALFVQAMGAGEPSSRLDVLLGARPNAMAEVARTLEQAGVTISSIMTLRRPDGVRQAVVRIATINPGPALAALRASGYAVRDADQRRPGGGRPDPGPLPESAR